MGGKKRNRHLNYSSKDSTSDSTSDSMQLGCDHDYRESAESTEGKVLEEMIMDEKEFPKLPVTLSESPAAKKKTMKSVKTASSNAMSSAHCPNLSMKGPIALKSW